jgi:class 3 adenylate cyclase
VIESHGGNVEKFIGDAVVGVFGVPAVHEDDPERVEAVADVLAHHYVTAEGWREFGDPYEEGQALIGQGRCLAARGRAPEAAAPLAAAREIFARLGARPALAETDAVMQRIASVG